MRFEFAVIALICAAFFPVSQGSVIAANRNQPSGAKASSRAVCLVCQTGCTPSGVSKPFSPIIPSNLNLATAIDAVSGALTSGNDSTIEAEHTALQQAFEIVSVASQIATGIYDSVILKQHLDQFEKDLKELGEMINALGDLIEITAIYNQFNDERLNIEYQLYSLHRFLTAAPENQESLKQEFYTAFETSNYNQNLFNLYTGLNTILRGTFDATGQYRRLVADMGNDILQHLIGGTAAYFAYDSFKGLCADCVIEEWNAKLISAEELVTSFETQCVDFMKNGGGQADLYYVNDHCNTNGNYDYALSVYNSFNDKYDWLKWDITCYETPHGANSHQDDERGGDQYFIVEGVNGKTLTAFYMDINHSDVTDVALINEAMAHRPGDDNCDDQYSFLRSYGVQGSLLCCRDEWNLVNIPDNLGFFGPFNGGANVFYLACLYY